MWARGFAVIIVTAGLASAQVSKSPAKSPAKATKAPSKAAPKNASPPKAEIPSVTYRTVLPPKDESSRDKTLSEFLVRLKEVLKRKDRDGLVALLADNVRTDIPGMEGSGAFFTAWGLGD